MSQEERATVLVIDDDTATLGLLYVSLEEANFKTFVFEDGISALEFAREYRPDIILLDVMLPGMDGFDVCRRLREYPNTVDTPVIFLSALSDISDKLKGLQLDAVDYITKPFQPEEVVARIKRHLTIHHLRRQLEEQNLRLQQEIAERKQLEERLRQYHDRLEKLVEERTLDLQREIVEHQRTEEALIASEQQYRLLAEHVADGIAIFQARKVVFVNQALAAMLGYTPDQLLHKSPFERLREDYQEPALEKMIQAKNGLIEPEWQAPCITADGREIWVETRHTGIHWEGQPAFLLTFRDMTERKLKEMAMEKEKKSLQHAIITLQSAMKDRYRFGDIIGKSPVMQTVYELIVNAAASDASVFIYGESGVGKELVAQTIHVMSDRKEYPFVPVNCGAIPETLFEREFFGHRKGAFTGAYANTSGFFDRAHEGTLFLDEVGELRPNMQVKLLRAIEGGEYTPVGSNTSQQANVRVIAATNTPPEELAQQRVLRADFFYRLHVIAIRVPPLRDRKEDIPLLVEHFFQQFDTPQEEPPLPGNIVAQFYAYEWPGNVRELRNVVYRYLTLHTLSFDRTSENPINPPQTASLETTVTLAEKDHIRQTLQQHQGNRTHTAKAMGISLRTLHRKLEKYDIV